MRLFTLAEARALLPVLRPILLALQASHRMLHDARRDLSELTPEMRSNGSAKLARELEDVVTGAVEALRAGIARIEELGVELKDIQSGLVDFPAQREGRVVYLCWRVDEADIGYWHELDAGAAGRQPL